MAPASILNLKPPQRPILAKQGLAVELCRLGRAKTKFPRWLCLQKHEIPAFLLPPSPSPSWVLMPLSLHPSLTELTNLLILFRRPSHFIPS